MSLYFHGLHAPWIHALAKWTSIISSTCSSGVLAKRFHRILSRHRETKNVKTVSFAKAAISLILVSSNLRVSQATAEVLLAFPTSVLPASL